MREETKTFKILSIDGGGIKGLYSSTILAEFEKKFNCKISDHFDMLCGTSTGGLIALALSLKVPASEICDFYIKDGPKIFPSKTKLSRCYRLIRQVLWGGKYSDKELKKALNEMFGDKTIGDSNNLLCIPTYTITEARTFVIKKDHHNLDRDNGVKMVDAALATSAAPTYFPLSEIEYYDNKQFIDGGVWANNPTLVGLLEALSFFVGENKDYDRLKILSISSLSVSRGKKTGLNRFRSFIKWRNDLFETSLIGQSFFVDFFMQKIREVTDINIEYERIPSVEVSKQQESIIQLDIATKKSLDLIKGKGKDQADIYKKKPEIQEFFNTKKTYKG